VSKLEEIEKKLCILRDEFDEYKTQLKEVEQEQWPKVGDEYYSSGMLGARKSVFHYDEASKYDLTSGNCHRTKEQAIRHKEYITSPRVRARELVEMRDGFDQKGGFSIWTNKDGVLHISEAECFVDGAVRFTSKQKAVIAVNENEPLIKVALGVIVDEVEAERIICLAVSKENYLPENEYVGSGE